MTSPIVLDSAFWVPATDPAPELDVDAGPDRALVVIPASTQDNNGVPRHTVEVDGVAVPFVVGTDSIVDRGQTDLYAISGAAYDEVETTEATPQIPVVVTHLSGSINQYKYYALALSNVDTASLLSNVVLFEASEFGNTMTFPPISFKAGDLAVVVANYTQDRVWSAGTNGLVLETQSPNNGTTPSSVAVFTKSATVDETNVVFQLTHAAGPSNPTGNPNGNRKTGIVMVIKGKPGIADAVIDPVSVELGNTATFNRSGGFAADAAFTDLIVSIDDTTDVAIPLTTGTADGGTFATDPAQINTLLAQVNFDTQYLAILSNGTDDSAPFEFTLTPPATDSTANFWSLGSVADMAANTTVTPNGNTDESAALVVQMFGQNAAFEAQPGDKLWYSSPGPEFIQSNSLLAGASGIEINGEFRVYLEATQTWTEVLPVRLDGPLVSGDLTGEEVVKNNEDDLSEAVYNSSFTQVFPPGSLESDAAGCVSPIADGSFIHEVLLSTYYAERLVAKSRLVMPAANENAGPLMKDSATGWMMWAQIGNGPVMTLRRVSPTGVLEGVIAFPFDAALLPPTGTVECRLEYLEDGAFGGEDGWRIFVGGVQVLPDLASEETWWRDTTGSQPAIRPDRLGRGFLRENTLDACSDQLAGIGLGTPPPDQIISVNGAAVGVVIDGQPLVIERDGPTTHASNYTIRDSAGNVFGSFPVLSTPGSEDITANVFLDNARHGPLIIESDLGEQALAQFPPPAGRKYTDFGPSIVLAGTTAGWFGNDQVRYTEITNKGDTVDVLPSGHVDVGAANANPQFFQAERHDGATWQPVDDVWVFDNVEAVGTAVAQTHIAGTSRAYDLTPFFNATASELPADEVGEVGTLQYQIINGGPSLSNTGMLLVMPATAIPQLRTVVFQVTDPGGNTAQQTFTWEVEAAPDVTPPLWLISPTVNAVNYTTILATLTAIDADSPPLDLWLAASVMGDIPTAQQIIQGVQSDGITPLVARTDQQDVANGVGTQLTLSGLSEGTTYQILAVTRDSEGNLLLTSLGPQTTREYQPPAWTLVPVVDQNDVDDTSISVDMEATDADGNVDLYLVAAPIGDAPSIDNISSGVQSDGITPLLAIDSAINVASGTRTRLTLSGLSPETSYQVYAAVEDYDP